MHSTEFDKAVFDITGDQSRNPDSAEYSPPEKRELTGETTAVVSYNYLVQARDAGSDDRSIGGLNINLSGRQDAAGAQKKKHDRAVSDAVFVHTLNNINDQIQKKIEEYGEKIKALGERIENIQNALENDGEFEIDGDGTLKDKKLEDELRAIEDRTGKKVNRSDGEAIRAALLLQQMLLQEEKYDTEQKKQELLEADSKLQQSSPEEREQLIKELGLEEKFGITAKAGDDSQKLKSELYASEGLNEGQFQQRETAEDFTSTGDLSSLAGHWQAASFGGGSGQEPAAVAEVVENSDYKTTVEIYKPV